MSRHTVTCAEADSNWPIVPDWSLRRCTTGFMLSHKLSVSQCSHLALAQRHCGCPRPSPCPAPPSVRVNCPLLRTDTSFFCAVMAAAAVWAPTSSQLARVPRCDTRPTAADPPSSHVLPAARAGAALYKCGRCATRPRRSALVDSGACSIRSGARVQLGMRKGDHDMVHGLACMRGCSLVVQRVERGANFKNRV